MPKPRRKRKLGKKDKTEEELQEKDGKDEEQKQNQQLEAARTMLTGCTCSFGHLSAATRSAIHAIRKYIYTPVIGDCVASG